MRATAARLERATFQTSRLLEYLFEKELTLQTGYPAARWPEVILKELDNSLDACEDANTLPAITVTLSPDQIVVEDNGPGLPPAAVDGILDFTVRTSSKDAYISPTRGAQGNALKTVIAIPFVRTGEPSTVHVESQGTHHAITIRLDRIAQMPEVEHQLAPSSVKTGTRVTVPLGA